MESVSDVVIPCVHQIPRHFGTAVEVWVIQFSFASWLYLLSVLELSGQPTATTTLSNEEHIDMCYIYGYCDGNASPCGGRE